MTVSLKKTLIFLAVCLFAFLISWGTTLLHAQNNTFVYLPLIVGGGSDDADPVIEGELTLDEQYEAVKTIETLVNGLILTNAPIENRNLEQEVLTLRDALINVPNVFATVASTETLTAQVILNDGTSIQIYNNRPTDAVVPTALDLESDSPLALDQNAIDALLPGSGKAVVANFDGGDELANKIAAKLETKGYDVSRSMTIDAMINNYDDLAVLYLDTHGSLYNRKKIVEVDGKRTILHDKAVYSIQTSSEITRDQLGTYASDIQNGGITMSMAPGSFAKLGITETFIREHWSFKDALVFLHTCFAGAGETRLEGYDSVRLKGFTFPTGTKVSEFNPSPVRNEIFARGASQFVSFDYYTATDLAQPTILYYFDNMLGTTESQEDPMEIPFSFDEVKNGVQLEGLDSYSMPFSFPHFAQIVNVVTFGQGDLRLAPSLELIEVKDNETVGKLELTGDFGIEQGKVTIDDEEVEIKSWSQTKIEVETPTSGKGWIGEVVVLSSENIRSNPVQLREWSGTIDVTFDPKRGSLFAESKLDVVFRGIVHSYRPEIAEDELKTVAPATYFSTESEGTVSATGEATDSGITERWSGLSFMRLLDPIILDEFENQALPTRAINSAEDNPNLFGGKVYIKPDENMIELCLIIRGFYQAEFPVDGVPNPIQLESLFGTPFQSSDGTVTYQESAEFLRGSLACYTAGLLPNLDIEGGLFFGEVEESEYAVQWSNLTTKVTP
ncbi:MAG: hypothetical protein AAGD96_07440 [Chloroflexota bacterium]